MSAWFSHRLTAKPVSLSPASCASHRPRSPLMFLPLAVTVVRYVRSNSLQVPACSLPQVIRITIGVPPIVSRRELPAASDPSTRGLAWPEIIRFQAGFPARLDAGQGRPREGLLGGGLPPTHLRSSRTPWKGGRQHARAQALRRHPRG